MSLKDELGFDQEIEVIEHECLLNILFTATMIYRESFAYFRHYGITDAQFNVLIQLRHAEERALSQAVLGRRLVVNKADMTGIIDRLEKAGLVKRTDHHQDRRINIIRLTKKGAEMSDRVEPGYIRDVKKLMSGIPKTEMERIIRETEKIRGNIRNNNPVR